MNTKNLILISLLSSTLAMAGGDIVVPEITMNIEEPIAVDAPTLTSVYLGLGYAQTTADVDDEEKGNSVVLSAGYNYNQYIGLEARYLQTFGDMDVTGKGDRARKVINTALYLKPQYPVLDILSVYGLVGYGQTTVRNTTDSGLQWGAGFNYFMDDNINLFVDYTNLYDDTLDDVRDVKNNNYDATVDSVNLGINYTF